MVHWFLLQGGNCALESSSILLPSSLHNPVVVWWLVGVVSWKMSDAIVGVGSAVLPRNLRGLLSDSELVCVMSKVVTYYHDITTRQSSESESDLDES